MTWELVLGIVGFLTGSGALLKVFVAGVWKGSSEARVEQLRKDVDAAARASDAQRTEINAMIVRIHERLDEQAGGDLENLAEVKALIAGAQSQRADWEQLRNDVRSLLRGDAGNAVELANLKARLLTEEQRSAAHAEAIAMLRSALARLDRLEDELHRPRR